HKYIHSLNRPSMCPISISTMWESLEFHWKDDEHGSSCNIRGLYLSLHYISARKYWVYLIQEHHTTHEEKHILLEATLQSLKDQMEEQAMEILSSSAAEKSKRKRDDKEEDEDDDSTNSNVSNKRQKTEDGGSVSIVTVREPALMGFQQTLMDLLVPFLNSIHIDVLRLMCRYVNPVDIISQPRMCTMGGIRGMWMDDDKLYTF